MLLIGQLVMLVANLLLGILEDYKVGMTRCLSGRI